MSTYGGGGGSGSYGQISGAEAFSDPQTRAVMGWRNFAPYMSAASDPWRRFAKKGGEQEDLYNQFKTSYLSPEALAASRGNADIYSQYTKGLFANQPNQFQGYQQVGDYLYGQLDRYAQNSANAGNRAMNDRAAALGFGGQGSNSYLAKINADRITNNLAPVFANTTNAIGRDYNAINNNSFRDTMLRLGLASEDALGGYMDNVYSRPLDVANVRSGQLAGNTSQLAALVDAYNKNVAGYETRENSDLAKFGRVFDRWATSYGGGTPSQQQWGPGNQMSPGPQQQQNPYLSQIGSNPYTMPYNGYPTTPGPAPAPTGSPQDQAWMNEFNGVQPDAAGMDTGGYGGAY